MVRYIYIFYVKETNEYKIGYTSNMKQRKGQIQTGNSREIIIIQSYPCINYREIEKQIHDHYKNNRMIGEWFHFTNDQLEECKIIISKYINKIDGVTTEDDNSSFCSISNSYYIGTPIDITLYSNKKILPYGKEDLSHITEDDYIQHILSKKSGIVSAFIKYVHFNKNKVENHNIYINDRSDNYVFVFDGNEWKKTDTMSFLKNMIEIKSTIINDKFNDLINHLNSIIKSNFFTYIENKNGLHTEINNIKNILYNNRIISTNNI